MRFSSRIVLLLAILLCTPCFGEALSAMESVASLRSEDPKVETLPDSSLEDFSFLLEAPAGQHGFVTARKDGHFYFEDGKHAKFWGINISSLSLRQSHEKIEEVVNILARAGINCVRLEAIDNHNCLIDENQVDSRHFDSEYQDCIDYWIYQLKQHGIYYYLDLLDFRTFKDADGLDNTALLGRGAKPYALFDSKLIDLQKEYAQYLLCDHVNPYTRLTLAKDPGMAFVELFNEDGLLCKGDKWQDLAEPYATELKGLWNQWLKNRYGTTSALDIAWTNAKGEKALSATESLEAGTVSLPNMTMNGFEKANHSSYTDSDKSPARKNDACAFAYELTRKYCRDMKDFLVSKGVKIPVTAIVGGQYPPETCAVADELDFTAENYYYDHPFWDPGKEWTTPVYYNNNNQLQGDNGNTFAPWVTTYRWKNKPIAVREWTTVWPNQYRATSVPEAAAAASMQGVDCMLMFGYSLKIPGLGDFACQADPTRWGLMGIAAKQFLQGDVDEEKTSVEIVYQDNDLFNYYAYQNSLDSLAWNFHFTNVGQRNVDKEGNSFKITAGRGGIPADPGKNTLIFSQSGYSDLYQKTPAIFNLNYAGYTVAFADATSSKFTFDGLMYDNYSTVDTHTTHGFSVSDVNTRGYKPIGLSSDGLICLGFYDPGRNNYVFRDIQSGDVRRIVLDALTLGNPGMQGHQQVDQQILTSANGQLKRNMQDGLFYVRTDNYQAIVGALPKANTDGVLSVTTNTPFGAIVATSLDDRPLKDSTHYLIKMVTTARNTGQKVTLQTSKNRLSLDDAGNPPIITDGQNSDVPTVVTLGGKRILEIGMTNGTWELLREDDHLLIFCDTPGVPLVVPGNYNDSIITGHTASGEEIPVPLERRFRYPSGVKYVVAEIN